MLWPSEPPIPPPPGLHKMQELTKLGKKSQATIQASSSSRGGGGV